MTTTKTPYDVGPADAVHRGDPVTVDRYTVAARINHWITAISMVLLFLSGIALFYPTFYGLTALFGGGQYTRALHPWFGVVLTLGFIGLFFRFWRHNLWKAEDGTWTARIVDVLRKKDEELPEVGKYNAGQKMVFWSFMMLVAILFFSGLALWDQYFFGWTTIEQKRYAVLIHALAAIFMICVWITHVYAAIWVRGTIRGMVKGSVTGGWAWRFHRKWLRELVGGAKSTDRTRGPTPAE